MNKVEKGIRDYLDSWSKSRTFDHAVLYDLMYQTVSIFQEANGDILEDLLLNAFYSTPGLFHYLIEVNEIGKALGDKYTMLSSSVSLSSVYSSILLNYLEGPFKQVLMCILYALKKKSTDLTYKRICRKYSHLKDVVDELQSELQHVSNEMIRSSILANITDVNLPFIRNKVAHHDYYIVTMKKKDKSVEVKGILFIHKNDINNPRNFYLKISKLGECIRWIENLIILLISSIDVFIKTSLENRGLCLEGICKRCNNCGSWKVDLSMRFLGECQVCSRFK